MSLGRKYFQPKPVPGQPRAFYRADWQAWWDGLTEAQRQSLRDKARWEHMSLSAVAMEWGVEESAVAGKDK